MRDLNQKENKETIISRIVIRDFKLGRDSTKEKNTKKIMWMRGKVEYTIMIISIIITIDIIMMIIKQEPDRWRR